MSGRRAPDDRPVPGGTGRGPTSGRVMVFIDGQNLYKSISRTYNLRVHPVLLGRELIGDREHVDIRYYSGVHLPREDPDIHALAMRRHKLIRATGVTVIERTLRYHWEWRVTTKLPRPEKAADGETHPAKVKKYRAAREKGIDLALGLDAVTAALDGWCDTLIIVSRDRDLMEVAREIKERTSTRNVRVEVALVEGRGERRPIEGYDYTHWIDKAMAERCVDEFDYRRKLPKGRVRAFLERVNPDDAKTS